MQNNEAQNEQILASAIRYLLEGDEIEAATLLMSCTLESWHQYTEYYDPYDSDTSFEAVELLLRGPRKFFDEISSGEDLRAAPESPITKEIRRSFYAVFGSKYFIKIRTGASIVSIDTDWRTRLLAESETKQPTNQNSYEPKPIIYMGMRFSSQPEVEIAKALDRLGVMYLPNCLVRVGSPGNRETRFPDFLISHKGKWGILEVDGKKYHTGRAAEDHDRSRQIERHGGIAYFTRFDAMRCMNDANGVVKEFLDILEKK